MTAPVRSVLVASAAVLAAVVVQTTLFGRLRLAGIAPDVVVLTLVIAALRLRSEALVLLAFTTGLVFDALSSTALGLRGVCYTILAYVAVRTRERADSGPAAVAVWAALLTALAMGLFFGIGTLFGQIAVRGGEAVRQLLVVPVLNLVIALALTPLIDRLLRPSGGFGRSASLPGLTSGRER